MKFTIEYVNQKGGEDVGDVFYFDKNGNQMENINEREYTIKYINEQTILNDTEMQNVLNKIRTQMKEIYDKIKIESNKINSNFIIFGAAPDPNNTEWQETMDKLGEEKNKLDEKIKSLEEILYMFDKLIEKYDNPSKSEDID
jgi:hypothetical protein